MNAGAAVDAGSSRAPQHQISTVAAAPGFPAVIKPRRRNVAFGGSTLPSQLLGLTELCSLNQCDGLGPETAGPKLSATLRISCCVAAVPAGDEGGACQTEGAARVRAKPKLRALVFDGARPATALPRPSLKVDGAAPETAGPKLPRLPLQADSAAPETAGPKPKLPISLFCGDCGCIRDAALLRLHVDRTTPDTAGPKALVSGCLHVEAEAAVIAGPKLLSSTCWSDCDLLHVEGETPDNTGPRLPVSPCCGDTGGFLQAEGEAPETVGPKVSASPVCGGTIRMDGQAPDTAGPMLPASLCCGD